MPELVWAYGVVRAPAAPAGAGVEGRAVMAIEHGALAVLASTVPSERFDAAALAERLEDMATLARLARAHDAVLEAAVAAGDVVPFRMCTIYETPDAVRAMLAADASRFQALLDRLHDMAEWGVKAFVRPPAAEEPERQPASGIEYLARRRRERERVESDRDAVELAVADVHAELAARAADAALSRPHARSLTGRDGEMLLNGAYLVARAEARDFASLLDSLRRRHEGEGVALELTGPWPPYHFVGEVGA